QRLDGTAAGVVDLQAGTYHAVTFALAQRQRLVAVVGIEAQVPTAVGLAVLPALAAEDQAAVFHALVVEEDHAGRLARMLVLVVAENRAREAGPVGHHHPQRTVGLAQVDALHVDGVELRAARGRRACQHDRGECEGKHTRIGDEELLRCAGHGSTPVGIVRSDGNPIAHRPAAPMAMIRVLRGWANSSALPGPGHEKAPLKRGSPETCNWGRLTPSRRSSARPSST